MSEKNGISSKSLAEEKENLVQNEGIHPQNVLNPSQSEDNQTRVARVLTRIRQSLSTAWSSMKRLFCWDKCLTSSASSKNSDVSTSFLDLRTRNLSEDCEDKVQNEGIQSQNVDRVQNEGIQSQNVVQVQNEGIQSLNVVQVQNEDIQSQNVDQVRNESIQSQNVVQVQNEGIQSQSGTTQTRDASILTRIHQTLTTDWSNLKRLFCCEQC